MNLKKCFILVLTACLALLCACRAKPPVAEPPASNTAVPVPLVVDTPSPADETDAFFEETRAYILTSTDETVLSSTQPWDAAFVDAVDYPSAYQSYLQAGGHANDVAAFAYYLATSAPAPSNWKELFEKSLMENYQQSPERYEDLGDGIYQVYVQIDGASVPYVTVNARTGWYHG